MIYEHRSQDLLPRKLFLVRILKHGAVALGLLIFSLTLGICPFSWAAILPSRR